MNEIIGLAVIIGGILFLIATIIVTLCVFAMCGYTEKMMKTLAAMEHLMRHGK